jgi:nicotinamide mononucleotide transporter
VPADRSVGSARIERAATLLACALGALLVLASWRHWVETDLWEAVGFVTGGACVWLGVKQNVWNWPIGIANNVAYVVVFVHARLFADTSLQVAFAALGLYGWYAWVRRNGRSETLAVSRTPIVAWIAGGSVVCAVTVALARYLATVNDAAPFLDALTTSLSLGAQFAMTRKYLESWWIWISVDVISIGLYAFKHLELTALLYAIFMAMCVAGLREWRATMRPSTAIEPLRA